MLFRVAFDSMKRRTTPSTRSSSFQSPPHRATANGGTMSAIDNSAACTPGAANARRHCTLSRAPYRIFVGEGFHSAISYQRPSRCEGPSTRGHFPAILPFKICATPLDTHVERNTLQLTENNHSYHPRPVTGFGGAARQKIGASANGPRSLRRLAIRSSGRSPGFSSASSLFDTFTTRLLACQSTLRFPPRRPSMSSEPSRQPIIEFRRVNYRLANGNALLKEVSFTVPLGDTLVLLGRSGAGKTTALKMINRLVETHDGEVCVEGKSTLEWNPIALRRRIGYVIQETGLFPHYTVEENISLVPKLERWPPQRIRERVQELLLLVGLPPAQFMQRYPHELSGGQRQRVGVARALAADPPILLMDEPFGALDPLTRGEVRREFNELQRRLGKTIVIVTHDISEALLLGTRIGLMDAGELRGIYSPREFLRSTDPVAAAYVAQLRLLERAVEET